MRLLIIFLSLCVISFTSVSTVKAQGRAAQVEVDAVIVEDLTETVPVIGRIVARQEGPVAAKVEGPIEDIIVEVGDRVETGDVIAVIEAVRLQLERDMAQSEYNAALAGLTTTQSQIELLSQERDRLQRLRNSAAFSRAAFDDKQKEIVIEQSRLEAERARAARSRIELERRATDLEDATIRAPYPGVVVRRHVSAGAYVRTGDPIVEMINDGNLEIEADVPTERILGLSEGVVVSARLADDEIVDASFRAVVPVENVLTRTRAVRFVPQKDDAPGAVDTVGESVTIDVPLGASRDVVTVHKDAVTVSRGNNTVFVVQGDKAVPQPVGLGASIGNRFEVLDDSLKPGDMVVTRGNERLRPGQQVTYEGMPEAGDGEAMPENDTAPEAAGEKPEDGSTGSEGGDQKASLHQDHQNPVRNAVRG